MTAPLTPEKREFDEAIAKLREACEGWPQPNSYDAAVAVVRARVETLEEALRQEKAKRAYLAECAAVIVGAPCCEPYLLEKAREINRFASDDAALAGGAK